MTTTESKNEMIVWNGDYLNTAEFVKVETGTSIRARGYIAGEVEGILCRAAYELEVDLSWNIKSVYLEFESDSCFVISLHKNENDEWLNEKAELLSQFHDCTDIDISLTPFTNTLPINRLNLPVGSNAEDTVIYINLPTPECKPVKQRYTNLGNNTYKYENLVSGFVSHIQVDENGYVINYPGFWHRIFPATIT